jgi:hypothetical protein
MTQPSRDRLYRRHRFPAEIITHANLFHFPHQDISSPQHRDLRNAAMETWRHFAQVAAA